MLKCNQHPEKHITGFSTNQQRFLCTDCAPEANTIPVSRATTDGWCKVLKEDIEKREIELLSVVQELSNVKKQLENYKSSENEMSS